MQAKAVIWYMYAYVHFWYYFDNVIFASVAFNKQQL